MYNPQPFFQNLKGKACWIKSTNFAVGDDLRPGPRRLTKLPLEQKTITAVLSSWLLEIQSESFAVPTQTTIIARESMIQANPGML
jgi:hypothetical protein